MANWGLQGESKNFSEDIDYQLLISQMEAFFANSTYVLHRLSLQGQVSVSMGGSKLPSTAK